MIIFQSNRLNWQIDLTNLGITFNEESPWFSNDTVKNYSFPFTLYFSNEIAEKLGLINHDNAIGYQSIIEGYLIVDDVFYEAYIELDEIEELSAEATIYYGGEALEVYNTKLSALPWPVVETNSLIDYAKTLLTKTWPETTHNYPAMRWYSIIEKEGYEHFMGYVNNYNGNFITNFTNDAPEEVDVWNRNVMAPFPYLLEIFRFGYLQEGKSVRGEFFTSEFWRRVLYVPGKYFERYSINEYDTFRFDFPAEQTTIGGETMGVYQRFYVAERSGTYQLNFDINFSSAIARYFSLVIKRDDQVLYSATSNNRVVSISEEMNISIPENMFEPVISIEMIVPIQDFSIDPYNTFEFLYKEGAENIFPRNYTLSGFLPDMTFGEFVNDIKNWLNLDIDIRDNEVVINFLDNSIKQLVVEDQSHLEVPDKRRKMNNSRVYKLSYANEESVVVDATGQIYNEGTERSDIVNLDMNITPMKIEAWDNKLTGDYDEDAEGLVFCLYDGLQNNRNYMVQEYNGQRLTLQDTYDALWKNWLHFRTNSKTFTEKYEAHIAEKFSLKNAIYKYNEQHLVKTISKRRITETHWEIDQESETF